MIAVFQRDHKFKMENVSYNTNRTESLPCQGVNKVVFQPSTHVFITAGLTAYLSVPNSLMASVGNILVIYTITTCKQLQTPSNVILTGLSIFDFLTGAVSQPMFIVSRILEITNNQSCLFRQVSSFVAYMCIGCSMIILMLVNIDRVFAVAFPIKRKTMNLTKKYIIVMLGIWMVLTGFLIHKCIEQGIFREFNRNVMAYILFSIILCGLCNIYVYFKIRSD